MIRFWCGSPLRAVAGVLFGGLLGYRWWLDAVFLGGYIAATG